MSTTPESRSGDLSQFAHRLSPTLVEVPVSARADMRVPVHVWADEELWRQIARDRGSPEMISKQSYDLLVRLLGRDLDEWGEADKAYQEWQEVHQGDPRASKWFPAPCKAK